MPHFLQETGTYHAHLTAPGGLLWWFAFFPHLARIFDSRLFHNKVVCAYVNILPIVDAIVVRIGEYFALINLRFKSNIVVLVAMQLWTVYFLLDAICGVQFVMGGQSYCCLVSISYRH